MASSKDEDDYDSQTCGKKLGNIFVCIILPLIPIAFIAFAILSCILSALYKQTVAYFTAYRGERLPTFIEFYAYAWILHPLRRIRVSWRRFILRFRNHALLNVPLDCTLPQELFEDIISCCYPDRKTLLTCSLVCKAWVPTSRCLLWISVHSGDRVRELVKLLNSPDNAISPYVQTVSLSMYTKQDGLIRYRHALRTLANADAQISRAKIVGQSLDPARALYRYFPHLRRLSFIYEDKGDAEEKSAANFRHILFYSSLFCDLQRLSIQFTRQGNSSEDVPLPSLEGITLPAGLRSLSLKSWNKDLLRWWRALDPRPVNALLRPCRTSLQFITLTIVEWENGFLDLGSLTELRTVVLYVYHIPSGKVTLSSLNSSHIETITIITSDGESMVHNYLDDFMTGLSFSFSYGKSGLRQYVPSMA
ncbi:hypothetical protein EV421DRAFT_2036978 [Armillaria borealis]|uniref:F-box domain-containing protein n=1 Tax=Armillaria borealis TaxID=47425 RepID=A0AA39JE50_9AGAR|nr:hypothetical protein EV421DRAFT_2036978 [Armillaria borealis]